MIDISIVFLLVLCLLWFIVLHTNFLSLAFSSRLNFMLDCPYQFYVKSVVPLLIPHFGIAARGQK
jgi:hypothetical protein